MVVAVGAKNRTQIAGKVNIPANNSWVLIEKPELARMQDNILDIEIDYFEKNKADLLERAKGEFALIYGEHLINTYKSEDDAFKTGYQLFGNQPFLVKKITESERPLFLTPYTIDIGFAK